MIGKGRFRLPGRVPVAVITDTLAALAGASLALEQAQG
jgi:glucokinase